MAESGEPPYDVGYAKPPSRTRFKPGQSGNPRGRPRGAKNFVTAIEGELRARVTVTENGRRKRVTKREVIAKRLVNRAAEGDLAGHPPAAQRSARIGKPAGRRHCDRSFWRPAGTRGYRRHCAKNPTRRSAAFGARTDPRPDGRP